MEPRAVRLIRTLPTTTLAVVCLLGLLVGCTSSEETLVKDRLGQLYAMDQDGWPVDDLGYDPSKEPLDLLRIDELESLVPARQFYRTVLYSKHAEFRRVLALVSVPTAGNEPRDVTVGLDLTYTAPSSEFIRQFLGVPLSKTDRVEPFVNAVTKVFSLLLRNSMVGKTTTTRDGAGARGVLSVDGKNMKFLDFVFSKDRILEQLLVYNPNPHAPNSHGGPPCPACKDE